MRYKSLPFISLLLFVSIFSFSCHTNEKDYYRTHRLTEIDMRDSGGKPIPEQTKYDVTFYNLNLRVEPDRKWIGGTLEMNATATQKMKVIILHLDTLLKVNSVEAGVHSLSKAGWVRNEGLIVIFPQSYIDPGERFTVKVGYAGYPLAVEHPDKVVFGDGFYFAQTVNGRPWVSLVSVFTGADVWMPVKDHPMDEPDSMALNITAPENLVVASNGKLLGITENSDQTRTHHWFVSTPINNYGITVNIAPYKVLDTLYHSVSGDSFPFQYYVLPEDYEKARAFFPNMVEDLSFLEDLLGPYPFRADKAGAAQPYYHGMETQTITAYNAGFRKSRWGFTITFLHELAHEWIANMVTVSNWKDIWIHEGIVSYIPSLYAEKVGGIENYRDFWHYRMGLIKNNVPVVQPGKYLTIREAITLADTITNLDEDFHMDVYNKGSAIIHTLRFLIGKDKLLKSLRSFTYPQKSLEKVKDGSQTRFTNTADFVNTVEKQYGKDLGWFFDAYLYHAKPPRLDIQQSGHVIHLAWQTPSDEKFHLPVPVMIDRNYRVIPMKDGASSFAINNSYKIDPYNEILRYRVTIADLVSRTFQSKGIEAATALHHAIITSKPDSVYLSESTMNRLGYNLLSSGKEKFAIAVFGMNIDAYPNSPNCYDSMADAYKQSGDLNKAADYSRKALDVARRTNSNRIDFYESKVND